MSKEINLNKVLLPGSVLAKWTQQGRLYQERMLEAGICSSMPSIQPSIAHQLENGDLSISSAVEANALGSFNFSVFIDKEDWRLLEPKETL